MRRWIVMCLAMLPTIALASPQAEINHLLQFVETTSCQYERNGKMHTGTEALEHIEKKYDYFADDISTAEDFIRLSATKSELSGKLYRVHCDGVATISSQEWLLAELERYRAAQN
uniref:DUF5329 family protein n=1 Tax=Thaumasiovibrio occultus TaxID=1891184 RepID=UPI000B3508DB|nr:DUF5329 domain-containing protein [Thaumasiovibrio occultus]